MILHHLQIKGIANFWLIGTEVLVVKWFVLHGLELRAEELKDFGF